TQCGKDAAEIGRRMTSPVGMTRARIEFMKNLGILHLESISRARLSPFPAAFPNLRRLLAEARTYDEFVSSATSTMMVITYFFHANDYEFDAASQFTGAPPACNKRHLFSIRRERGYATDLICLNGFHHARPRLLGGLSDILPPVWGTA